MSTYLGRIIIRNEKKCHGEPNFAGTRILFSDIWEQVASGMDWKAIIGEWQGSITIEAISEAEKLAKKVLSNGSKE